MSAERLIPLEAVRTFDSKLGALGSGEHPLVESFEPVAEAIHGVLTSQAEQYSLTEERIDAVTQRLRQVGSIGISVADHGSSAGRQAEFFDNRVGIPAMRAVLERRTPPERMDVSDYVHMDLVLFQPDGGHIVLYGGRPNPFRFPDGLNTRHPIERRQNKTLFDALTIVHAVTDVLPRRTVR